MEKIKKSQIKIKNAGKEICELRTSLEYTGKRRESKVR